MILNHIAVYCSSEEKSDRFYGRLLGLKKANSRMVPVDLIEKIFGIRIELKLINYTDDHVHFEVFVGDVADLNAHKIGHICLEVDDREAFIKACETMGLKVNRIPRNDSFILFINDDDGNLFEIKERQKQ